MRRDKYWSEKGRMSHLPTWKEALNLLFQFCIGGVVVAGISAASVLLNTKDAALLYALPVTYVPVLVYVWRHNKNTIDKAQGQAAQDALRRCAQSTLVGYVGQNVAGFTLLTLFCMCLYFIIGAHSKRSVKDAEEGQQRHVRKKDLGWIVAVGIVFFAILSIIYWEWVCEIKDCEVVPAGCVLGST